MPAWLTHRRLGWAAAGGAAFVIVVGRIAGDGPLLDALSPLFWLCAGTLIYLAYTSQSRRHRVLSRAVQQWAQERGWAYAPRDDSVLAVLTGSPFETRYASGEHMAVDVVRACRVTGRPSWGGAMLEGDAGEGRDTISFTFRYLVREKYGLKVWADVHMVAMRLPVALPRMLVQPEGVGTAVAKAAGAIDHLIESADFNDAYFAGAEDPRTAHAILNARLAQRLLEPDLAGGSWEINRRWIRTWDATGTRVDVLDDRLRLLDTVVDHIPRHVWLDARSDARRG